MCMKCFGQTDLKMGKRKKRQVTLPKIFKAIVSKFRTKGYIWSKQRKK